MSSRLPRSKQTAGRPARIVHPAQLPISGGIDRASVPYLKRRSVVYSIGIAVIAGAGALVGASVKTQQQVSEKKASKKLEEVTLDSRISQLESRRGQLLYQKQQTEQKIATIRQRQLKKHELEMEKQKLETRGRDLGR